MDRIDSLCFAAPVFFHLTRYFFTWTNLSHEAAPEFPMARKTISPAELQQTIARQPDAALLDVRTLVEFAEVHVSQAQNLPLD
jgi:hypothetical protein